MRAGLLPDAGRGVCVVKEEVDDGQVDGHTQSLASALLDNRLHGCKYHASSVQYLYFKELQNT